MPNSHSAPLDYRRILAAAPALFLILDKDAQFTILDASDAYLRATLTRREAIVGRPLFEVFPDNPEEIGATGTRHLRASLHRVLASRGADTMAVQKYDVRRPEGGGFVERYWSPVNSPVLSPDGDILWIVHRVEDVTELVRANAALQRDGESMRIEVLLRSQELDEANRKMREANEQFRAIYDQGFFAGRLALDGTVLDVNRSSLATGMNVTERVEAERRRSTEAALVEADRHKDEFIATLSHELRSPLAPIRNALSLLRLTGRPDAKTTQVYAIMDRQLTHLVRLVDDLLELSRVRRGQFELRREPVELGTVLQNAIETSAPVIADAGHQLVVEPLPQEPLWVHGDRVRLAQIFSNLLDNAARFTERGGRITVRVGASDGQAEVRVRDTGSGISPQVAGRLFDMFVKSDRSSGLGIGLALSRRLTEMHGGSIEARSEADGAHRGSEFTIRLPLTPPRNGTAPAPAPDATAAAHRVLVADDNRDSAELLAAIVTALGSEVTIAYDGAEAVEESRAPSTPTSRSSTSGCRASTATRPRASSGASAGRAS